MGRRLPLALRVVAPLVAAALFAFAIVAAASGSSASTWSEVRGPSASRLALELRNQHLVGTPRADGDVDGAGNVTYHGGPVMRTNTTYAIYWIPSGYAVSPKYESVINGYFKNVAAASGSADDVNSVDTEYSDTTGPITGDSTFGGSVVDTDPFPPSSCSDAGLSVCLTDAQLQTEIDGVIKNKGWSGGTSHLFFLFTPQDVGSCADAASTYCGFESYCAYHSFFESSDGLGTIIYANDPYVGGTPTCDYGGEHPNDADADATLNDASHEMNESITDPLLSGWYDDAGGEIADKCVGIFGGDEPIGSGTYNLQEEWSNKTPDPTTGATGNCLQRYSPTLLLTGSGTGEVASPAGISCDGSSPCDLSGHVGEQVTLTATPATGSAFAGWLGDCTGTGDCTLTIRPDTSLRARFTSPGTPAGWSSRRIAPPATRDPMQHISPNGTFYNVALSADGSVRAETIFNPPSGFCAFAGGNDVGGVYLERPEPGGWSVETALPPPDLPQSWPDCPGLFGLVTRLSRDGKTLLVSEPWVNDISVAHCGAFIYRESSSGWTLDGTLYPPGAGADGTPDPAPCEAFGANDGAISSDGSRVALLGCAPTASGCLQQANVYVREPSGWTFEQAITAPADDTCDQGGYYGSLALSGDGATLLLGGPGCAGSLGRVFAYTRSGSTWSLDQTIDNPAPNQQSQFGSAIALSGDGLTSVVSTAAFGANAWVYRRTAGSWQPQAQVTDPENGLSFTCGAVVRGGSRLVCSNNSVNDGFNQNEGAIYLVDEPGGGWQSGPPTIRAAFATDGFGHEALTANSTGFEVSPELAATEDGNVVDATILSSNVARGLYPGDDRIGYEFSTPELTISYAGSGQGSVVSHPNGIDCGSDCAHAYEPGTPVTLTAAPAAHSIFTGWSGACSGTGTCTVTMRTDRAVTANFELTPEPLTINKSGRGTGTVTSDPTGISCGETCTEPFPYGTTVTLSADPSAHDRFVGWGAPCSQNGICQLTLTSAQSVTAQFSRACVVPKVKGKKLSAAKQLVRLNSCQVGLIRRAHSTKVRKGHVISQHPGPGGGRHRAGFEVGLVISSGRKR